jgi:hypothetical protein
MARRQSVTAARLLSRFERIAVVSLCLLAALRVFLFAVAFPFFNNVDERRHFDLVVKYASGHIPRGTELISPASLPYLARYASPEFLAAPETFEHGYFGPFWTHPADEVAPTIALIEQIWARTPNQECSQPPLYYAAAGVWFNLGRLLGLNNGTLLYWVRFLNIALVVALVWIAYSAARIVFPNQPALQIAVPLLVASIPQDAFYGIDNDVLSPICFGSAFVCLIRWLREDRHRITLGILTGASIAAAYLTKLSNLPLVLVLVSAIIYCCCSQARPAKLRQSLPALAALACCAGIPIIAWMIWTKIHFGDFTGAASKAQLLGWTAKPFAEWWSHPIFTPSGFWTFLSELIASFWRGEFMWHGHTMGSKRMDLFYVRSSIGLFVLALVFLLRKHSNTRDLTERRALWIAAALFVAAVAFLAFLSLQFDFGNCINPSRERPYFFQGRLMSGAMIPFALLYVYALARFFQRWPVLLLATSAAIALLITITDACANRVAFSSAYNWFHM